MKNFFIGVGIFIGIVVILFILELTGLGFFKFFRPKYENARREIFEETQSYVQGKIQQLAKLYVEYNDAETLEDKDAIKQVVIMQFAEFDAENIRETQLKLFLKNMRGY